MTDGVSEGCDDGSNDVEGLADRTADGPDETDGCEEGSADKQSQPSTSLLQHLPVPSLHSLSPISAE